MDTEKKVLSVTYASCRAVIPLWKKNISNDVKDMIMDIVEGNI
jgi:hypothetical protein